jgi:hypothetical protein
MGTAELTAATPRRLSSELRGVWLGVFGAIWATTLVAALIIAVVGPLQDPARDALGLRLQADQTPAPRLDHMFALSAHNLGVAAWPVLLGVLGAHRRELTRHLADALLAACVAVNVLPVGAALGAYGAALLPYIPQLPLEWAGLALSASAWLLQRRRVLSVAEGVALTALTACVILLAATLETLVVPHEQRAARAGPAAHQSLREPQDRASSCGRKAAARARPRPTSAKGPRRG